MLINLVSLALPYIALTASLGVALSFAYYYGRLSYCWFPYSSIPSSTKRILFINFAPHKTDEAISFFHISLTLHQQGHKVIALVKTNSWLEQQYKKHHISYYHCQTLWYVGESYLSTIVKKEGINIIQCADVEALKASQKLAKNNFIRLIISKSSFSTTDLTSIHILDGILTLNSYIPSASLHSTFYEHNFVYKDTLPAFFNSLEHTKHGSHLETAFDYFEHLLEPHTKAPYIVIAGNTNDAEIDTILNAAILLKYKYRTGCNVVFLNYALKEHVQEYAHTKKIDDIIHCLPPAHTLYYTLQHAHTVLSYEKNTIPLPIIHAAWLKKPILLPSNLSSQNLIIDNTTGILFDPEVPSCLADKLHDLLINNHVAQRLGGGIYEHVSHHFPPERTLLKLEEFYNRIFKKSGTFL